MMATVSTIDTVCSSSPHTKLCALSPQLKTVAARVATGAVGKSNGSYLRFAWLLNFRRTAIRTEFSPENFLGMLQLACVVILLRYV
jgi:transposase